jgi:hypothetical protein
MLMDLTFRRKILICIGELLKVFPPSTTPLENENFIRNVELTIPRATNLSILKKGL